MLPNIALSLLVSVSHAARPSCATRLGRAALVALSVAAGPVAAGEAPNTCAARPTDVVGSLEAWRDAWSVAPWFWSISTGKDSTRSEYEIHSRYNGLGFVLGVPPERMMDALREVGREVPLGPFGWGKEDYARMGEAALLRGRPVAEAMTYLNQVYALGGYGWNSLDFSRAAAAGYTVGASPEKVAQMMRDAYRASRGWWTNGTFSRVAEGALLAETSAVNAVETLETIYRAANTIISGWNDDDYARVARAALLVKMSGREAAVILDRTYRLIRKDTSFYDTWNYRDYSRMAAAAIITGKSPDEAARTLTATWDNRGITKWWSNADYSTMAAAALMGRGQGLGREQCGVFNKAW